MSNEALTWAFRQDLPMTQKFVLVALADYADERGECFPKHETTAARTGANVRTVQRAIAALMEAGFMDMDHQYRDDGRFRSNRYRLNLSRDVPRHGATPTPAESHQHPGTVPPLPRQRVTNTPAESRSKNPHRTPKGTPRGTVSADAATADRDSGEDQPREDVDGLCELLADCIAGNGSKRPTITRRWRDAARLLLDRDGRTVEQVAWIIRWSQADDFWRANVLSMPKLREKFDTLRLQAQRDSLQTTSPREREIEQWLDSSRPCHGGAEQSLSGWEPVAQLEGQEAIPFDALTAARSGEEV